MQFLCFADIRCCLNWSNVPLEKHAPLHKTTQTSALTQKFSRMAKVNMRMRENRGKGSSKKHLCHGHQDWSKIVTAAMTPYSYLNLSSLSSFHMLHECKMDLLEWTTLRTYPCHLPVGRSTRVGWERCCPVKERGQMRFGEDIRSSLGRK